MLGLSQGRFPEGPWSPKWWVEDFEKGQSFQFPHALHLRVPVIKPDVIRYYPEDTLAHERIELMGDPIEWSLSKWPCPDRERCLGSHERDLKSVWSRLQDQRIELLYFGLCQLVACFLVIEPHGSSSTRIGKAHIVMPTGEPIQESSQLRDICLI